VLIDFGFSVQTSSGQLVEVGLPQQSHCGTDPYEAPEIKARSPYDPTAADVWSLGVVLLKLLTGEFFPALSRPASPSRVRLRASRQESRSEQRPARVSACSRLPRPDAAD